MSGAVGWRHNYARHAYWTEQWATLQQQLKLFEVIDFLAGLLLESRGQPRREKHPRRPLGGFGVLVGKFEIPDAEVQGLPRQQRIANRSNSRPQGRRIDHSVGALRCVRFDQLNKQLIGFLMPFQRGQTLGTTQFAKQM